MLRGSRRALVRKIQPVSIHGQISLDVSIVHVDREAPEGQVSLVRVAPESVPHNLQAGDPVDLHYVLGVVTHLTRPA